MGAGVRGRARGAEDLPGESGGVGDAPQHVGPGALSPIGVNGARPGVDRARRVALEAEAVGAAPRCFDGVVLLVALIPVHPSRGAGAGSGAGSGHVGGEGVVLLVRAGSGGKGVGWPCDGGSSSGGVRCGLTATPGRDIPAVMRGRPRSVGSSCGGRAASWRGAHCCWPAGAVVYCALAQVTRSVTRSPKRVAAASSDSWRGRRSRASTLGRPV